MWPSNVKTPKQNKKRQQKNNTFLHNTHAHAHTYA